MLSGTGNNIPKERLKKKKVIYPKQEIPKGLNNGL